MAFPSPTESPPVLSQGQFSFRGLTFGGVVLGTHYQVKKIEGLDMPIILSGDQQRPQEQGEFAGIDVLPGRDITIVTIVNGETKQQFAESRLTMGGIMTPAGRTEYPLWVATELGTYACMARPRKHNYPLETEAFLADGVTVTSLLHATDPRIYAAPSLGATASIASTIKGLSFGGPGKGVSFKGAGKGVSFGGGKEGATLNVENQGTFEMRPILVVNGPVTNPRIANLSLPGGPFVGFELTVPSGGTLTVDLDMQTVVLKTGAGEGGSWRNSLMVGSTWWNLPAESSNAVQLYSEAGTGSLEVQYASAWTAI